MTISNEAVEAAARAIYASKAEGCGCCAYPEFTTDDDQLADKLDINVRALLIAREALEAAAPHMLADVAALADQWEARGEHDMAFSKTVADEDIAMTLLTEGASKVENARHIRNAIAGIK